MDRQDLTRSSAEDGAALYLLLGKVAGRYLMGDSSSLPVETAGELFESIRFCLSLHAKTAPGDSASLEERFEAGRREAWRMAEDTKGLLLLAESVTATQESQSYRDTLRELGEFFRRYDPIYFAHEIPCMIDYPLAVPVPDELRGVEFVREYLTRLVIESRVLALFDPPLLRRLWTAAYADYSGLLVNLFEPVLLNALGRSLLGREVFSLRVSQQEKEALFRMFRPWDEAKAKELVRTAATKLTGSLNVTDEKSARYLGQCAEAFLPRLRVTSPDGWGRLFW